MKMADDGGGSWHAVEYEVFMSSFEIVDAIGALTEKDNRASNPQ
jgi:hypothetical protein